MDQPLAPSPQKHRLDTATIVVMLAALLLIVHLHLLAALLAALLVYELVETLTPQLRVQALRGDRGRLLIVTLLATAIVALLSVLTVGAVSYLRGSGESLPLLMQKLAEIVDGSRNVLPLWITQKLPTDAEEVRIALVSWLRENAYILRVAGSEVGRAMAHIIIGMVIGALMSLHQAAAGPERRPLADALWARGARLASAFRRVVFAQFWIASINTFFTWCYLALLLPAMGVELPLIRIMVVVTFLAGLIPVLGNLISNTVIVIVSLSHSLFVALGSLAFLVVIHKLEYFLNARIIGSHIRAKAWELLMAMLMMEAAFGIGGVVAAPIYYAYLKDELTARGLV